MFGYLLFGLTITAYILILISALQPNHSGGSDAAYGAAMAVFVLLAAFSVCSLLLTINITIQGGFDWISDSAIKRNIGIAVIWLGMMAGVAYCTAERIDYNTYYQLTGSARLLSSIIYYGAAWLPLLMLVPYFLFLKPEWRDTLSPNLFKIPLVLACFVGFSLFMSPKIMKGFVLKSYRAFEKRELAFNEAMKNIEKYDHAMSLFYYTSKSYDEQIRNAALAKIKARKNLEAELIEILEQSDPLNVFDFWDENKAEHPERFIKSITKSFERITADMHEGIVNPYKGIRDVVVVFRVLEEQFKDSAVAFKPQMLKLQEVMETPPAKTREYDDPEKCNETLYKNRAEIKKWLDAH